MLEIEFSLFTHEQGEPHEMIGVNANENVAIDQDPHLVAGATINERFVLVRPLGRGAMGSVWLARHLALDIDVALKFVDSSLASQPNYVERFRREARAAAQLASPHVVSVLDYGTDERGRPFMAMEYLCGTTLGTYLADNPRPSIDMVARIITQAARGLSRAHELGIVHRDIKPENLFLCGSETPETLTLKILDFGVAKGTFTASGHGTLAGQLVGSPAHMSPEQARGYKTIDHRSDLFSLGIVAYQCLTGWHPFSGAGVGELLLSVCTLDPEPPSSLVSGLPLAVDAWFEKALAKRRGDRFSTAREMSLALCDALGPFIQSSAIADSPYETRDRVQAYFQQTGVATLVANDDQSSGVVPVFLSERAQSFGRRADATPAVGSLPPVEGRAPRHEAPAPTLKSHVHPSNIADAFVHLTHIVGVRGAALFDPRGDCLLCDGPESNARLDALIFSRARAVAETVESIDRKQGAANLCVQFGALTVYVRWMSSFALVVRGEPALRALLITVGSDTLANKLEALVRQAGAPEPAARLLGGTGEPVAPPAPPARPPERPTAHPLRRAIDADVEPVYEFSAEEVPTRRERPLIYRGKVLGSRFDVDPTRTEASPRPSAAAGHPMEHAPAGEGERRERRVIYRGRVLSGKDKSEEKPKERMRIYRGRVLDE